MLSLQLEATYGVFTLDVKSSVIKWKSRWHPKWHTMLYIGDSLMLSECLA
jgi:hypothetical protein